MVSGAPLTADSLEQTSEGGAAELPENQEVTSHTDFNSPCVCYAEQLFGAEETSIL